MAKGSLIVKVYGGTIADPINEALVEILDQGIEIYTKDDGITEPILLDAPDKELSEFPQHEIKPYSTYDIRVSKEGMTPTIINNVEIFPDVESIQEVFLVSSDESNKELNEIDIDDPTLWGDYAPKNDDNLEEPINPIRPKVLPVVSIPEYIIVHDGTPSNTSASNYYVAFQDYIKNVACSEIYSTWPTETIRANVIAIISFTLNRIYTEWYRSKGYNFTITSTTTYDQKYTLNRTLFATITKVVDQIFNNYIRFPGRQEPFLAHYNDGINLNNKGWLNQWGSKELGDKGYKAVDILKYYYGSNLTIQNAPVVSDLPMSFPGYNLKLASCGEEVQLIQNQLNKIRGSYPAIPIISNANGEFNQQTVNAVKKFQSVFGLSVDGVVGFSTWYKISYIFTAVSKLVDSVVT